MSNKLVLQDLVDLLAKKSKITKKEADSFFRELFQLILDRIFENDSVKIKDFGTFKLVMVSSRESVDVNTGEKIEIRAHSKLSFVPDKALKTLVNKPFSQFETILLEEEVSFDASIESDEGADNEVEEKEYIIDIPEGEDNESDDEISVDSLQSDIKNEEKADDTVVVPDVENSKPITSPLQYPSYNQSFVYTYTTTSTNTSDSITITLPKTELPGITPKPITEEPVSEVPVQANENLEVDSDEVIQDTPFSETDDIAPVSAQDPVQPLIETEEEDEDEETELPVSPLPQEEDVVLTDKKDEAKEKRYIEPIIASGDKAVTYVDSDSEIETEEDVVLPPPIVPHIEKPIETYSEKTEHNSSKHKQVYSEEDPERPLFPDDEDENILTDDDFVELSSEDSGLVDKNESKPINHTGNNKPASIRSVSYTETIDDVEIPYHDYYAPTLGQKIKKALPWLILGLAVLGFVGYKIIPMFNVKYDYENKLKRVSLTTSDTLPLMDQEDVEAVSRTSVLLDSARVQPAGAATTDSLSSASNVSTKSDTITEGHVPDRKISENLKIDIINKAQMYIQRYPPKQEVKTVSQSEVQNDKAESQPATKIKYDTIRRGVTLRNLATKHYGNADYWVYIYEANKKIIRNPNSVPIGTNLVMPVLSAYGVRNPKDPKEVQKAQSMAAKILR